MNDLAAAWVRYYLESGESDYWAVEQLEDLCAANPPDAWKLIKAILRIEIRDSEWESSVMAVLGCGPLEDLIACHPDSLLDDILEHAKSEPLLRKALSVIYASSIDKHSW